MEKLLLLFRLGGNLFLDPLAELLDGAPERASQLRKLAGTENQERDEEDEEKFRETDARQVELLVS